MSADLKSGKYKLGTWGAQTRKLLLQIMSTATVPGDDEVHFLTGPEAARYAENETHDVPVITHGEQPFRWEEGIRPIEQFFHRLGDLGLNRSVSVQVPSRSAGSASAEDNTVRQAQKRFLDKVSTQDPWNLLDLHCPVPATEPRFLHGDNCQLLQRVRDMILSGQDTTAERITAPRADHETWRDVLAWALLSQGGNNTAPHIDSHGYST